MTLRRKATRFATRFTTRAPALLRTREAIVWTALTGLGLYLVALGLSPLAPVLLTSLDDLEVAVQEGALLLSRRGAQ